jgi:hypothetical protein
MDKHFSRNILYYSPPEVESLKQWAHDVEAKRKTKKELLEDRTSRAEEIKFEEMFREQQALFAKHLTDNGLYLIMDDYEEDKKACDTEPRRRSLGEPNIQAEDCAE